MNGLFLKLIISMILKHKNPYVQCLGEEKDSHPDVTPATCVYPVSLSRDDTTLILRACKRQKVTVQSGIQAAACIAISELIQEGAERSGILNEDIGTGSVGCTTALRGHMDQKWRQHTSYVISLFYGVLDNIAIADWADADRFWERADHVMKILRSGHDAGLKMTLFAQTLMVNRIHKFPKARGQLLGFTNLGNCNYINSDAKTVRICGHFSASGEHKMGPVFANCITTLDGRMFWGAVYFPHVTSRHTASRYLNRSVDILLENCRKIMNTE